MKPFGNSKGTEPDIFQGRREFLEWEHFDKYFINNTPKKGTASKNFGVFLPDVLKTAFQMRHLTYRWTQSAPFFPKSGHFLFRFSKKGTRGHAPFPQSTVWTCSKVRRNMNSYIRSISILLNQKYSFVGLLLQDRGTAVLC